MRKVMTFMAIALLAVSLPAFSQSQRSPRSEDFASDFQTIPVVANLQGIGSVFTSYVALYNPTSSAYSITATLYDGNGTATIKSIPMAKGELKTYANFLDAVFNKTGGGAVTLQSPASTGGTHNNRFIVSTEIRASGAGFAMSVPVLEFAGTGSRSFSPGVTVDSSTRTNVGCFNQTAASNSIKATILDNTGTQTLGSLTLNLLPNAWGQAPVTTIVSGGIVRFEPSDSAVCYAAVIMNATNDGRIVSAAEYTP